jgi:DNA-binding XRE family transcriptional regulator
MCVKMGDPTAQPVYSVIENGTGINNEQARMARQFFNLSAEFVANQIGVTPQHLIGIEQGHVDFEVIVAKALKEFYEKRGLVFIDRSGIQRGSSGE